MSERTLVELERYDFDDSECDEGDHGCAAGMEPGPDGEYVRFADVLALLREADRAEVECARLGAALEEILEWADGAMHSAEIARRALYTRRRCTAAPDSPGDDGPWEDAGGVLAEEIAKHVAALSRPEGERERGGIYVASKTKRAPQWLAYRKRGYPIISTWIDEAEEYATLDWTSLWRRCLDEASRAAVIVMHAETGDVLRGAIAELGAALNNDIPVLFVGDPATIGNLARDRRIRHLPTLSDAMDAARALAAPAPPEEAYFLYRNAAEKPLFAPGSTAGEGERDESFDVPLTTAHNPPSKPAGTWVQHRSGTRHPNSERCSECATSAPETVGREDLENEAGAQMAELEYLLREDPDPARRRLAVIECARAIQACSPPATNEEAR